MSQSTEDALELCKSSVETVQATLVLFNSVEKLSSTLGALGPLIGVAAAIMKLALGGVDSPEMAFMKEQFQAVRNQLDVISGQISKVLQEISRSTMENQYFRIQENIKSQFRKYMDILRAAPEYRQKEKEEFLKHFDETKTDQNLHSLYDGVMGFTGCFGKSILDTAMDSSERNRRLMESLCAALKKLFCVGVIALVGHAAITGNDAKALEVEWNEKLARVEGRMNSMISRCIYEFEEQARMDVNKWVQCKGGRDNRECSSYVLNQLVQKYNWVHWSVRVYDPVHAYANHCVIGCHYFHFFRHNGVNIVVSYTTNPSPVDEFRIRQLMKGKEHWSDPKKVVDHIHGNLPGHVVHVVRRYKNLWYASNFPGTCHFWENYSGVTLCVHRE
ncbi:protein rapunzel-like [Hypanus sabinus]|uniref:protein rapunzel-like n=1 Tax=Hypanus sabinus TaxID=79690 RepID=UPI0028C47F22|nr:protein rapunzel-like [Hypanus sabinus]XP_059827282.1 protein rapunzel-like [Hypanus sabinus]